MAFLIIFACYITVGNSASNLTIQGYMPNTNRVGTNLSGPAVSLIALNAIYNAMSLSISGILMVTIWYIHHNGPWYHSTIPIEL
jgi:hypothetical protein